MSEFINLGPGNFIRNAVATAPSQPVKGLDDQEFAGMDVSDQRRLCRRGCTVRDMEKELNIPNPKEEKREAMAAEKAVAEGRAEMKAVETVVAASDLEDLNVPEAVELIEASEDVAQLEQWAKEDGRKGVLNAIAEQLELLSE